MGLAGDGDVRQRQELDRVFFVCGTSVGGTVDVVDGVLGRRVGERVADHISCPLILCRTCHGNLDRTACADFLDRIVFQDRIWFHLDG